MPKDDSGTPPLADDPRFEGPSGVAARHDRRLFEAQHALLEQQVRERTRSLENALRVADEQRSAAERANQAKASFLAHMSHELRTPLNGVLGMLQLARPLATSPEQRRYLQLARESGQSLQNILGDVLDFANAEAGRLELQHEDFDLAQLATDTLRTFMPGLYAKSLQVNFDYVGDITRLRGDAGRVRQILSNLISNAIKFTERGYVLLVVETEPAERGACRVRLRMRDSGIGMDAGTVERVFHAFEQGDSGSARRHGGTGLGLSIVRLLARMMNGSVSVRSTPALGSEFSVELLIAAQDTQPVPALAASSPAAGNAWLLVQNAPRAGRLQKRLARIGWTSEVMPDVAAAVERLAQPGPAPGCLVIAEDALAPDAGFAQLRACLPAGVPVTLLLRPDFDVRTVRPAAEQWQVRVVVSPMTPADLYDLVRPDVEFNSVSAPLMDAAAALHLNVLVVEDNPLNQIIAREMVAALGLVPAVVASGEEAVRRCRDVAPDLVLMDIQMPGMDGLETTRRLRALQAAGDLRPFPIVALTAHAMASDRHASLDAGMDEHLTKPIQLEHLRHVLGHWLPLRG
jgi:signal transduction histidine kinase/CheY-like chemotaxis protein